MEEAVVPEDHTYDATKKRAKTFYDYHQMKMLGLIESEIRVSKLTEEKPKVQIAMYKDLMSKKDYSINKILGVFDFLLDY